MLCCVGVVWCCLALRFVLSSRVVCFVLCCVVARVNVLLLCCGLLCVVWCVWLNGVGVGVVCWFGALLGCVLVSCNCACCVILRCVVLYCGCVDV